MLRTRWLVQDLGFSGNVIHMYGIKTLEHGIQSHSSLHAVLGCRFTGGQLQDSRPWGTGGVWLEPYDEERAKASKKRLFDAWHQSPAELTQRAQAGPDGTASDTEANTGSPLCYLGPWALHMAPHTCIMTFSSADTTTARGRVCCSPQSHQRLQTLCVGTPRARQLRCASSRSWMRPSGCTAHAPTSSASRRWR